MNHPPMRQFTLVEITLPAWLAWDPGIYYGIGAMILLVGLVTAARTQPPSASFPERFIALGPTFFAVPMAVFGVFHLLEAKVVAQIVPSWLPGHLFWAYFIGVCLISGALSLVIDQYAGVASALFGILLLSFVLLLHVPSLARHSHDRVLWGTALRDLALSGGAFAFAATHISTARTHARHRLLTVARIFIAIPILFFAVQQFLHPEIAPGVPLDKVTPTWIPGRLLWSYVTSAVYTVTGFCLLWNKWTRSAAATLGLVIVLICLFVYLPIVFAIPADIANGLNYFVDVLLLSGSSLALAAAQRDP
jgi:uncharacterized membrane protein